MRLVTTGIKGRILGPMREVRRQTLIRLRGLTAGRRVLPSFLIIGAQKAGTTSLYEYICRHPSVTPAFTKELHFFDLHYEKGLSWYRAHFPRASRASIAEGDQHCLPVRGESSPYYLFHPLVAPRVAACVPKIKLIVVLRNPTEKAISHYVHERKLGFEHRELLVALREEQVTIAREERNLTTIRGYRSFEHQHHSYLSRGLYAEQLRRWMQHFPRESLLILESEAVFTAQEAALRSVSDFLALSPRLESDYPKLNVGSHQEVSSDARAT